MEQDDKFIQQGAHKGKCIAVFTSGGDSQGMNAALRAVVRVGIYLGCKVFFIREGYQGMVDGGEYIAEATWQSVSGIIHKGGTIIGSARCQDFRDRKGRLRAAFNLIKHSITNLVVIGGDGSLTGAALFQQEWPSLVAELASSGKLPPGLQHVSSVLNIVGLVGSIDNDFCGTDMTIGTDSALHRIVEAVDAIASTADSHRRTFIMEVMGRHCGYLALVGGLCCGADYVFIPEQPEDAVSWRDSLCDKLTQERASGQRLNIIIVSEGAVDNTGAPITAEQVREVVVARLNQDARVTVLGHVQRGGSPSSFDRVLACRMGAEAVLALLEEEDQQQLKEGAAPWVITLDGNHIARRPLASLVGRTQAVALAMSQRRWEEAVALRGRSFARNLDTFKMLTRLRPPPPADVAAAAVGGRRRRTLAVMHVGAPACGMNAAVRSFVRSALYRSGEVDKVLGIQDGVEGLLSGDDNMVRPLAWEDVSGGWVAAGGATLGTKRTLPGDRVGEVLTALRRHNITGLLIVGGFEAFRAALQLSQQQQPPTAATTTAASEQPPLHLVVIPCTISNNVPGTDFSLGSDTALNEITAACDRIRQSAQGTKRRVFVVETQGGYCGYLATVAALASGADTAYIHEEPARIDTLHADLRHIASKMVRMATVQRGLVLRNERSSDNYNTDFLHRLYAEEGKGLFSTRINVLGHIQQGGSPSPFDRNMATKMACKSVEWLLTGQRQSLEGGATTAVMLGIVTNQYTFTPLEELLLETNTDFQYRLPKQQWWLRLRPLLRILARHDSMEEQST